MTGIEELDDDLVGVPGEVARRAVRRFAVAGQHPGCNHGGVRYTSLADDVNYCGPCSVAHGHPDDWAFWPVCMSCGALLHERAMTTINLYDALVVAVTICERCVYAFREMTLSDFNERNNRP
jgi:hypothetical protein